MAGKITITSRGVPGGSDKQVQFNDGGAFGGCAQLYWDKVNDRLGIGLNNPSDILSISDGNRCTSFGVNGQDAECSVQAWNFIFQAACVDSANEPMRIKVKPKGSDFTSFMMEGYGNEIGELTTYGSRFTFTSRAGYETSINYNVAENVNIWKTIAGSNPYFEIYGRNVADTDNDYVKMRMGTGAIDAFIVDVFDSDDAARHPILLNPSGGNVGINTTATSETLNVGGGLLLKTVSPRLKLDGVGGIPGFEFYLDSVRKWLCYADSATGRFDFKTNTDIRMTILQAGNVGIGVVAPAEKLEVGGAIRLGTTALTNAGTIRWTGADFEGRKGAAWVSLTGSGGDFSNGGEAGGAARTLGNTDNYHLGFKTNNTVRLHVNNDGSIGINKTTSLGTKLDIDGNFRAWYTKAGSGVMEVCGTHRMLITGNSLSSDFFAGWVINIGPTGSGATRNVVGMEINVQESESDQGLKASRTGKSSTILQIVPESTFDSRSGYNVSFGAMFSRGSHTGNPRMHVGVVAEQFAIVHQGAFMLLHGGNGAGDQPNAAMDLRDNWLCGVDTAAATLSYAFKTANNQPFVSRNAADNATKELIKLAPDNQVQVGRQCINYVNFGQGSSVNDPMRIRVGGVDDKTILVGAADSGGAGYRMLRVGN